MSLQIFKRAELNSLLSKRLGETKLGELAQTLPGDALTDEALEQAVGQGARYALIGISDAQPSGGGAGKSSAAQSDWRVFLQRLLNLQSNFYLDGREILIIGDFAAEKHEIGAVSERKSRPDSLIEAQNGVFPIVALVRSYGLIPIVIGGKHQHAFSVIKGTALGLSLTELTKEEFLENALVKTAFGEESDSGDAPASEAEENLSLAEAVRRQLQNEPQLQDGRMLGPVDECGRHFLPISVINCDAKGRFAPLDGYVRVESDNALSYAKHEHYLHNYCLINYSESENSANMLSYMRMHDVRAFSYESVFIRREISYGDMLDFAINLMQSTGQDIGLELDFDSVMGLPSYESSLTKISLAEAAGYIYSMASSLPVAYCYLSGGIAKSEFERTVLSKGLVMLVSSFVKGCNMQLG